MNWTPLRQTERWPERNALARSRVVRVRGCRFPPSPPQEGHPRDTGSAVEEWPPVRKHETGRGHLRPLPS